ncbi:DUF3152 domain-containing protein [Micromonospora sp. NPDC004551]|uniref:DUF3152 domain-containing protein n=1 Tax=Micromonospora sp. NPDC004551 TaxID=3154284 RepID=UPI0033BED104
MGTSVGRARGGGTMLLLAALLSGCAPSAAGETAAPPPGGPATVPAAAPVRQRPVRITYPGHGHGRWRFAAAEPVIPGGTRTLLRYRVAVEGDIGGVPPADFAAEVTRTLADPRGWTADGRLALRRVGRDQAADFTIYLVTPGTRDELCQDGPDGYTSCRRGDRVVLNVARWATGAPGFGASLATYRRYMVNHEVGHRLGHGHERCPGRGRPAPVMQQQTLGLHGCTPNALPYPHGRRYAGPLGAYADQVPPAERGRPG